MNTEKKIINAAISVFSKHGYSDASIRKIANKAGVNSAMINYYFKSKHNLYEKILSLYLDEFINTIKQLKEISLEKFLSEFITIHMQIIRKRGEDLTFLILREYVSNFHNSGSYLKEKTNQILHVLNEKLNNNIKKETDNINVDFLIALIIFTNIGLALKFRNSKCKNLSETFVNILLNGIKKKES